MAQYLSVIPAYGRDYKSAKAVRDDWNTGKDFLIQDFQSSGYINKDDKPANTQLNIRYKNLTQTCVIK